jgi:hypothetical protein
MLDSSQVRQIPQFVEKRTDVKVMLVLRKPDSAALVAVGNKKTP